MSAAFFNDPENSVILQICRTSPGFIPMVLDGKLHPARESEVDIHRPSMDRAVPDLVLGLKVLGCDVTYDEAGAIRVTEPSRYRSAMWRERARQLMTEFYALPADRKAALRQYLRGHADDIVDPVRLW